MTTDPIDPLAKSTAPSPAPERKVVIGITGMSCATCVSRVEQALKKIDGVIDANVQLSFPPAEAVTGIPGAAGTPKKITAVESADSSPALSWAPAKQRSAAPKPQTANTARRQRRCLNARRGRSRSCSPSISSAGFRSSASGMRRKIRARRRIWAA